MRRLFRQFSFPGGIPSHVAPETPGSIHEGGELGYALAHAYGAAFDNPDLVVCCVVGDGEAETGPLAASWHSNKFLDPVRRRRGAARSCTSTATRSPTPPCSPASRRRSSRPCCAATATSRSSWRARDPARDARGDGRRAGRGASTRSARIQPRGAAGGQPHPPALADDRAADPEGLDRARPRSTACPIEGTWRSHQVPLAGLAERPEHLAQLEEWLRSYRPEELFDADGAPVAASWPSSRRAAPRRMSANPHANGGALLRPLLLPDFRDYAVDVPAPGATDAEATRVLGGLLRDVMRDNAASRNFRLFGPDETASNRLGAVFEVTDRAWEAERLPTDEHLAPDGRVMEVLTEHLCQGWLEGYLLTGRHGLFSCYEAFIHIVDSMFNQHAKWLKVSRGDPVAAADRLAELPAHLARVAAGPQRLLAPGPRLHRPRGQQEGRDRARLPAAGRQHACSRWPTTACAAATTST